MMALMLTSGFAVNGTATGAAFSSGAGVELTHPVTNGVRTSIPSTDLNAFVIVIDSSACDAGGDPCRREEAADGLLVDPMRAGLTLALRHAPLATRAATDENGAHPGVCGMFRGAAPAAVPERLKLRSHGQLSRGDLGRVRLRSCDGDRYVVHRNRLEIRRRTVSRHGC